MSEPYVIWWLDQAACELAVALGAANADWPDYIKSEFKSRYGRAGRGRLWVPLGFKDFKDIDWQSEDPASIAVGADCGGIVIHHSDVYHVLSWPGFVTDRELQPIRLPVQLLRGLQLG